MQLLVLLVASGDLQQRHVGGSLLLREQEATIRSAEQAVCTGNHVELIVRLLLPGVVDDHQAHTRAVRKGFQPDNVLVVCGVAVLFVHVTANLL